MDQISPVTTELIPTLARPLRPKKRHRTEVIPTATTEIAELRQQINNHKRKCQEELREIYRENLTELFFLQHGLNLMDYATWKKRPNPLLANFLASYSLDQDEDEVAETPKVIQTTIKLETTPVTSSKECKNVVRQSTVSECSSQVSDTPNKEQSIVEQARKEAEVLKRISELRKTGMWSQKRLPKVQEPLRTKAHWDYLLEEMQWLAADFAQERKWKRAGCRKISKMVMRFHNDRQDDEKKMEREEGYRLKRIAGQIAKQIKDFWSNIEKVVQYKMDSRLDERRRQVMDVHLNFIVDQTEKYSTWLTEGLNQPGSTNQSVSASPGTSKADSQRAEDSEFKPMSDSADDEETIAKEEASEAGGDSADEIAALRAESEMPIEELLKSLPSEVLDTPAPLYSSEESDGQDGHTAQSEEEFSASDEEDDEHTLDEQEAAEEPDSKQELAELEAENEMTVEELAAKYAGAYASDFELPDTPSSSEAESGSEGISEEEESEQEDPTAEATGEEKEDVGLDYLLHPEKDEDEMAMTDSEGPGKGIRDIAATAQSFQPTGYTLETTEVKTAVPFLLKHSLREYQHVGLDWLATMYDKKLNGILADEMGLGKTIQTIALLAHLACEHEVWGPHLIVVPTSVMLNWELELKKWCPAFKILTYYGSPKDRRLKRVGWTKTNAFHVCITSYKLVIQDHVAFRRKKWRYLILDEAQNIKNFKSQRWQTLLNFSSQRRLLLTGTPLQNNLMELWSLMHFLMPHVFQSHADFKEWFSNPLTGMIEGNTEYNEQLIRRLHKVLRPFLLRRLKIDVEKQMPKKYEHVVMCKLSKRQRHLYEEFMSRKATKETLDGGNFMSVINILMQLRKVCNHPDMFDPRPIISPFETDEVSYETARVILKALQYDPLEHIDVLAHYPSLSGLESQLSAYSAHRSRHLQVAPKLIEAIDEQHEPAPRPPPTKLRPFVIRSSTPVASIPPRPLSKLPPKTVSITSSVLRPGSPAVATSQVKHNLATLALKQGSKITSLVASPSNQNLIRSLQAAAATSAQNANKPGQSGQRYAVPTSLPQTALPQTAKQGVFHIIQTSSGQHLITSAANVQALTTSLANSGTRIIPVTSVVMSTSASGIPSLHFQQQRPVISQSSNTSTTAVGIDPATGRPVLSVAPIVQTNMPTPSTQSAQPASTPTPAINTPSVLHTSRVDASAVNGESAKSSSSEKLNPPTSFAQSSTTRLSSTSQSGGSLGPASRKRALESEARNKFEQELRLDSLTEKQTQWRKSKLDRLVFLNRKHCAERPVYGSDLHDAVNVWRRGLHNAPSSFQANSHVHCQHASLEEGAGHPYVYCNSTNALTQMIVNYMGRIHQLKEVLERFVMFTPSVKSSGIRMPGDVHRPVLGDFQQPNVKWRLEETAQLLHPIQTRMLVQFPEKRLIQYDCGKLQTLDRLLRELKPGQHRVLIFTQMTKMLDVLEVFLNYHGHRYLRLDGTTGVEKRQLLMDRFNADKRIFVFILSTRSGGIGVNLTGADTVIFYDSDWNPTMDAQAQDRCHRIGQTRDVHIYRLISEKTIEENILKKANQKRMLGDVAIEGGNFTTAKLQQTTITDLFAEPSGLASLVTNSVESMEPSSTNVNSKQLEQALGAAEDDEDVAATKVASEEVNAELAEFDENIPWDEREAELRARQDQHASKVEREIALIEKELTPVERYAISFIETTDDQYTDEAVQQAEEEIEEAKRNWELNRLKDQHAEEERKAALEDDEMLYTYSQQDSLNKVFKDSITGENMPMWCPPTPPRDENDVHYVDQSMEFLYDTAVMSESSLPPVFVKKERKRATDHTTALKTKKQRMMLDEEIVQPSGHSGNSHRPPRSLFDRPANKLKRDKQALLQKHPALASAYAHKLSAAGLLNKPHVTPESTAPDAPEWLIHEDWSLLQAVQQILQLPLNLNISSPAHTPNWDLVSETVSTVSRIYRSPKQCKMRYENNIMLREEGKLVEAPLQRNKLQSKKQAKQLLKQSKQKQQRVGQQYAQDNGSSVTTLHAFRFDCIKNVASKRTPSMRPTLANPTMRNPKHAAVLLENGIQYDAPMTPEELAKIRQERMKNEKKQLAVQEQQRALATQRQTQTGTGQAIITQIPVSGTTQQAILSSVTKSALTASGGVSITRTLPGSIVVNNPTTFTQINKRLGATNTTSIVGLSQVAQSGTGASNVANLTVANRRLTPDQRTQIQFMQQQFRTSQGLPTSGSPQAITVQQTATRLAIGTTHTQAKSLNPHQLHLIKQQQQRAGGSTTTHIQRSIPGTQGTRPAQAGKTAGTITSLPIQTSKTGGTSTAEFQQQILKQKLQVNLTNPQLASVSGLSGSSQATLVKTVNTVSTSGVAPNITIPASGVGVNINVSIAQQAKQGTQMIGKTQLSAPSTQLRQIQLLKHPSQAARPHTQHKIGGLTQHQLVNKGQSVQIVQTDNSKIVQGLRSIGGGRIQNVQQISHLFSKPVSAQGGATNQIQQIITGPASGSHGGGSSTVQPGQTIIATTQLITPANMHATITKMSAASHNPSSALGNVTVSLARPAIPSTASTVAIVSSNSVITQASLVNQSPNKGQSLTAGRVPVSLTQRSHIGTIGHGASSAGTSAPLVTITQPTISASPATKIIGSHVAHSVLQSLNQTSISHSHATATPVSIISSDTPPSSITIVSQPKPVTVTPHRPQIAESLIAHPRVVTEPAPVTITTSNVTVVPSTSPSDSLTTQAPDATRTYAMRPRKTT